MVCQRRSCWSRWRTSDRRRRRRRCRTLIRLQDKDGMKKLQPSLCVSLKEEERAGLTALVALVRKRRLGREDAAGLFLLLRRRRPSDRNVTGSEGVVWTGLRPQTLDWTRPYVGFCLRGEKESPLSSSSSSSSWSSYRSLVSEEGKSSLGDLTGDVAASSSPFSSSSSSSSSSEKSKVYLGLEAERTKRRR